jgi:hypothetical protein
MAYDPTVANALAAERRKTIAEQNFVRAQERFKALDEVYRQMVVKQADAKARLDEVTLELTAATTAALGVTDDFGQYSLIDQVLRTERFAGKDAAIDFIKANPGCTVEEAVAIYNQAALAARPADQQFVVQNAQALFLQYAHNAVALALIPDASWESFRALVVNLSKQTLMDL